MITLSDLSFKDQINLFYHATLIVGLHGAGFANTTFCQPNSHVIELKPISAGPVCGNLANKLNLNYQDINSLYSNLSSLTIFELNDLRKKYDTINYSSTEINSALQKLLSFPFYLMVMTVLSTTIMMSIKYN